MPDYSPNTKVRIRNGVDGVEHRANEIGIIVEKPDDIGSSDYELWVWLSAKHDNDIPMPYGFMKFEVANLTKLEELLYDAPTVKSR